MISRIRFESFKLLRDVDVELGKLNVIVGRNSVGKSTVLEGLHLLLQLATEEEGEDAHRAGRPGVIFSGLRAPQRLVTRPDATTFSLEVETDAEVAFKVQAFVSDDSGAETCRYLLHFRDGGEREELELPANPNVNPRLFFGKPWSRKLGSVVWLKLRADALAAAHYSERELPRMDFTGEGLPSVLQYLQGQRDGTIEAIEASLAKVVPGVRRVRTLPAKITRYERIPVTIGGQESWHEQRREVTGTRFEVEFTGLGWIPADQVSDGTLIALGLVTLLHHRPPRLVLLDDIDAGLHPVAQKDVIDLVRAILDDKPHVQVVATSHSPFVLDALNATEVFVAGAANDTATSITRLNQHPGWQPRSGFMRPGEFWSVVGENWVAEHSR